MKKQKYEFGDHVMVAKDLDVTMSHFDNDCEAIVIGSYADQYGGTDTKSYTIYIKGKGDCSWYHEHQLTLIKTERLDLLAHWKRRAKKRATKHGDLDWIFSHGDKVLKNTKGATIEALAACIGTINLWGSHGEGIVYYQNAMSILKLAEPYLKNNDKTGWLQLCE